MSDTAKIDGTTPNPGNTRCAVVGGVVAMALGILLAMLGLGGIIAMVMIPYILVLHKRLVRAGPAAIEANA